MNTSSPATAPAARPQLRVLFLSDSLPERNGTGAYYHDLLGQLRPYVGAVDIIQPTPEGHDGCLRLPLPGDPTQKLMLPALGRVRARARALRPNLIVSVTPGPFGLLGPRLARRHGCTFVSAYHTHFEDLAGLYWRGLRQRLVTDCMRRVNRYLCRRSATVLVNNSHLVAAVEALGAPRADVIGTPVDARFLTAPELPPPPLGAGICYAGRLAAEKNVEAVIEAARAHPDIPFTIGGDGPQRGLIEEAAATLGNLRYLGWLDREGLRSMIDAAALLVLPSHSETFGSVALEAMARGRPALVAAAAGVHDWPDLAAGLFALAPDESLAAGVTRLRGLATDEWTGAGLRAREAALAFNARTLEAWLQVMDDQRTGGRA
jgi:glycosyltransferase involved in cell wall biosynthesis